MIEQRNVRERTDLKLHAEKVHWVFEFKFVEKDSEAQGKLTEAVKQIQKKHYGEGRGTQKLIRVGLVYSGESKQIVAYEKLNESPVKQSIGTDCQNMSELTVKNLDC